MRNISPSGRILAMLFMAALVLLLCPLSNAQQEPTKEARQNSLQKGAWSLQFQLDGNFQPRTFQGTLLNIKRHYSEKTAVRLGVSINANIYDMDRDNHITSPNYPERNLTEDEDYNNSSFDLFFHYLSYPLPKSDVHLFLGVGPHIGFSYLDDDDISYESAGEHYNKYLRTWKSVGWAFGASGVLGVEWFLRHNVSLLTEYGVMLDYSWRREENNLSRYPGGQIEKRKTSRHGFNLSPSGVRFGMSVYF